MSAAQQFFSEDDRYEIRHSCRFKAAASSYLRNTPSNASNRRTWTWSCWFKRSNHDATHMIWFTAVADDLTDDDHFGIRMDSGTGSDLIITTGDDNVAVSDMQFKDTSAWYHLVVAIDTTDSTAANRVKAYVNGNALTFSAYSAPDQNHQFGINKAQEHNIGSRNVYESASHNHFEGKMAEINFVDGLQLDPSAFGETDTNWGHWKPKRYTGAHGTNGFMMNFHSSGNLGLTGGYTDVGSNFASVNMSAVDQTFDTPTNNFATWNSNDKSDALALTHSGTRAESNTNTAHSNIRATMGLAHKTGKWYAECVNNVDVGGTTAVAFGLSLAQYPTQGTRHPVSSSSGFYGAYHSAGTTAQLVNNGGQVATFGIGGSRDIHQVAYDSNNGQFWYGLNNTWRAADGGDDGDPAAGTNDSGIMADNGEHTAFVHADVVNNGDQAMILNSGTDSSFLTIKTAQNHRDSNGNGDFYYAPPTGFMAMCTKSLPTPKVLPHEHFNVKLYSGNDGTSQAVTGIGFQPDWVYLKGRSSGESTVHNAVQGVTKGLFGESNNGEDGGSNITSFDADGFTAGDSNRANANNRTIVAWSWKANGAGSSLNTGTINATVSANPQAGFSMVKYVGEDSQTSTVAHGLTAAPEIVIVKATSEDGRHWRMYANPRTYGIDRTDYLVMNTTAAKVDDANYWNDSNNTTTLFSVGDANDVNDDGCTFMAWCFHEVEGFSSFGVYDGNADADGTYIHLGFRPAWVMVKHLGAAESWWIWDNKRNPISGVNNRSAWDSSGNETTNVSTGADYLEFHANGVKHRGLGGGANDSGDGGAYLIMAFADVPFKYANAY